MTKLSMYSYNKTCLRKIINFKALSIINHAFQRHFSKTKILYGGTAYFSNPKNAAQLYSALDGAPAQPEDIRYTTLEGVLFMTRKNDMAFTVKNKVLLITEHQSTVNAPFPSEKILKLSDAYLEKTNTPMLELFVKVININIPAGHSILEKCRPLYEYSWFIQKVKDHMGTYNRDDAVRLAVKDCISEGIFADFVREHGSEAVNMIFTQFNLEDAKQVWYEEAFEDGALSCLIDQIRRKLKKGKTPETIAEDLDESFYTVELIFLAITEFGPDADNATIIERIWHDYAAKQQFGAIFT